MGTVETDAASFPGTSQRPEIVVGLLASPGAASELAESLLPEIADRLPEKAPLIELGQSNSDAIRASHRRSLQWRREFFFPDGHG